MCPNVYPILGNHDLSAQMVMKSFYRIIGDDIIDQMEKGSLLKLIAGWQLDGGQATIDSIKRFSPEEHEAMIDYLEEFVPYECIEVNGHKFLLVHGGIPFDKRHISIEEQDVAELIFYRPMYDLRYYENFTLVTGHTPTLTIAPAYHGKILKNFI